MYKIAGIACLGLMLPSTNINAQTADFENLTLPAESYWDGSDLSGTHNNGVFTSEFTSGDITFPNEFDTTWGAPGYWLGGFAYSNMTDSVTSGVGNKYSAKAGGGFGSSNYLIASNNSYALINPNWQKIEFKITNSTYAYNSMRDGDAFAKKFGGPSGNDPDWFKVTIKTYSNNVFQDSNEFYLADFRFSDNSQDYIVKDWEVIEVVSISLIDSVYFELSSSDVGMWGMNTPAFFCLDNLILSTTTNVNEISKNNFSFYPNPITNVLNINSENNLEQVSITDMSGRTIKTINSNNTKQTRIDVADLKPGIYFIQVVSNGVPQVQKFIKQ
ncbi:MAG: DUF4465 domain-containing protein [Bacteroidetes bacterium]|nr:DUF4465 domain-containing protein [Bacteroidota bacterium]